MDPYKFLHISPNPDGSLTRHSPIPIVPPSQDPSSPSPSLSKDLPLNPTHNTFLRLFLPKSPPPNNNKLPVILYFHGGGFILFSAASSFFHLSSSNLAAKLPAIVLSVDYRLAPEHRLPAAYDDALDALLWLRNQSLHPLTAADPWLAAHADFSRCFLMGSSSGGNIAFHLGLRTLDLDIRPLVVEGLVLNQPFFGGVARTESEVRMEEDKVVPLAAADLLWELSLPRGADRDHEYCNPTMVMGMKGVDWKRMGMRCLVRGYRGDPLVDRQRGVAEMMERERVRVVAEVDKEGYHGVELFKPDKAEEMVVDVRRFVYGGGGGGGGGGPRL